MCSFQGRKQDHAGQLNFMADAFKVKLSSLHLFIQYYREAFITHIVLFTSFRISQLGLDP
jgi:hypothetical protein